MKHFLITWHETDSNDCTVFDTYVAAESEDMALGILTDAIAKACPDAGKGGDFVDFYFPCTEECGEKCDGHGGTALRECVEYPSEEEARAARPYYRFLWSLPS